MADTEQPSVNGEQSPSPISRDPITNRWMSNHVYNGKADVYNYYLQYQRKAFRMFLDKRRDISEECGYPDTEDITAEDYFHLYEREPIAERVVSIFPQECWQMAPSIQETSDVNEETDFELALQELSKNLEADKEKDEDDVGGLYNGEEGNPLWEYLERVDRLAGIGSYGAILLGINDGKDLNEPLDLNQKGSGKRKLMFMRVLDETQCRIGQWETDHKSRRYGRPKTYVITMHDMHSTTQLRGTSAARGSEDVEVHWTRIVHIVDTLDSSEIYHVPRMRTVYNRLYDLHKLFGGSAEMYWQAAFFGIAFETQANSPYELDAEGVSAIRDSMEQWRNSLQRHMALPGVNAKVLSPTVVDPTSHIDTYITAICVNKGIPKRVFMGSERGELSSSQDLRTWMTQVKRRQNRIVTPRIIMPLINRLIRCGVLPMPKGYSVEWEDIASLTDAEKAQVAVQRTQAYATYVSGNVEAIMPYDRWLVDEMDYSREEALEIMKALQDQAADPDDPEGGGRVTPDPEQQRMEDKQLQQEQFEKGREDQDKERQMKGELAKQQLKAKEKLDKAVTKNQLVNNGEYGTVMIDEVPFQLMETHEAIDPADVLELETEPHVTILSGLLDNTDIDRLQQRLKMVRYPIYFEVEPELSLFKTDKADVLKYNVRSDQLELLNSICKGMPHANVHPKYQAHLTVAYLKPGTGEKYVGLSPPAGPYAFSSSKITYSDKDRNKLLIDMEAPDWSDDPVAVAMNKKEAGPVWPDGFPNSISNVVEINTEAANDRWLMGVDNATGYDPNQPRDKDGKWTKGGGGGKSSKSTITKVSKNDLMLVKDLPGSTGPKLMEDLDGKSYVVKTYQDPKRALNEAIANEVYRELGVKVPVSYVDPANPSTLISEYVEGGQTIGQHGLTPDVISQAEDGFVADATMANWDAVGYSKDNMIVTPDGTLVRVDQGGSLLFRAKGQIKQGLTAEVKELDTLRNPSVNAQAASVYGNITDEKIEAQVKNLLAKEDAILKIAKQDPDVHKLMKGRIDWLKSKYSTGEGSYVNKNTGKTIEIDTSKLANGESVAAHIWGNKGDVKFTELQMKKVVVLNPEGVSDKLLKIPKAIKHQDQHDLLKKIMPEGTVIKKVNAGQFQLGMTDAPAFTKGGKKTKSSGKSALDLVDLDFLSGKTPLVSKYKDKDLVSGSTAELGSLSLSDHPSVKYGTHFDFDKPTPKPHNYDKKSDSWWAEITHAQQQALKDFIGSSSASIRKSFTLGKPTAQAKSMVEALEGAPIIKGRVIRHVHSKYALAQADALAASPPGTYWSDVAPMSTSRKHNGLGSGTTGLSLIIQSKTARLIEKVSYHGSELEAITMPKTLYQVKQVHREATFAGSSNKRTVVELEEL